MVNCRILLRSSGFGLVLLATGCAGLPIEGPKIDAIRNAETQSNSAGFVLIDLDADTARYLQNSGPVTTGSSFSQGHPANADLIGVGDVLAVKIWEADPEGLFSSVGSVDRGSIPNSVVDRSGRIYIPYAGPIEADGRTAHQVEHAIVDALNDKAVEPQAHVTVMRNISNTVTVTGEVAQAGIVPLTIGGDNLLDVIASSGGAKFPSYESEVLINRDGKISQSYLSQIINTPSFNVYMQPGDQVHVERKAKTYSAFGAVLRKGRTNFGADKLSVLEAVGKVAGLDDRRANPKGVFVMRFENTKKARELAANDDLASKILADDSRTAVPVIYRIDLQDPSQYFFAQSIDLQDKDVIYVANAPSVEVDKFLTILGKIVGLGLSSATGARTFSQ